MCGIAVVAAVRGESPSVSESQVKAMRDLLAERGPDDAGFWTDGQVHIGHRRLAVNTPGLNRQPWILAEPQPLALAFNGELYECAHLRRTLESRGHRIDIGSDTELLAHAIAEWGENAPRHIRGMFAYVAWLPAQQKIVAARDALGVVPLYVATIGSELVFASEPRAILGHPGLTAAPDWTSVTHYLNSLRTTRGAFSMFAGVGVVQPGESMSIRLDGERPIIHRSLWWTPPAEDGSLDEASAACLVREAVERSVAEHAVSDVPLCALLSGGLDSTIIAS
jgi:asparagine synthase (glutamine-hydrolysing)